MQTYSCMKHVCIGTYVALIHLQGLGVDVGHDDS